MTFDASPPSAPVLPIDTSTCDGVSVCSLGGAERFLVWALRWEASVHADAAFAHECLEESFERAGLVNVLPVFRSYVAAVYGVPSPRSPASRLGCWQVNNFEAATLHAMACLQDGHFGDAWRTLSGLAPGRGAAGPIMALGEVAEALSRSGARVRRWPELAGRSSASPTS